MLLFLVVPWVGWVQLVLLQGLSSNCHQVGARNGMSKQLFTHLPGARPPVSSLSLRSGSAARPPHVASLRQDGQRASQNVRSHAADLLKASIWLAQRHFSSEICASPDPACKALSRVGAPGGVVHCGPSLETGHHAEHSSSGPCTGHSCHVLDHYDPSPLEDPSPWAHLGSLLKSQ